MISVLLEPLLSYLRRRHHYKIYTQMEWTTNETLQLQRLGQETAGWGTWSDCSRSVPTTSSAVEMSGLDLSEPDHPRLFRAEEEITYLSCSCKQTLNLPSDGSQT
jgi:hypothetical protein